MREVLAVYPGSFDPITNGHVDIILRGCKLFDKVIVAVVVNPNKESLFSLDERLDMLRNCFDSLSNVAFDSFSGLLADYAKRVEASVIVRGIRAITDFEYEMQMALMNRRLSNDFETVFMMPKEEYIYISSGLVKEIALLGGSVTGLVPNYVEDCLKRRCEQAKG